MNNVIFLDAGPLGLVTNPRRSVVGAACAEWIQALATNGRQIVVPEIAGYEVRRELLRANKTQGVANFNALVRLLDYLPITTAAMRQAALLWAQARQQGQPTAGDKTIDADIILAAQAVTFDAPDVVIATTNVGHLSRFVAAELWTKIGGGAT